MSSQRPLQAVSPTSAMVLAEEADERAHLAYRMRQDGKSWYSIAKALGLTETSARSTVMKAMERAAADVSAESKRQLLALEVARLDRMQEAIWGDAMRGNLLAIDRAIKIVLARAKVLGLDNMPEVNVTNNTLVVSGNQEEYVAALRAIAGERGTP